MVKELEVKILKINIEKMEEKIISLGGKLIGKESQVNTLIDSSEKPIKSYLDAYLRIRETKDLLSNESNITLTLKKNIQNDFLRENIELNTDIKDKDVLLLIFKELGFDKISQGFKERTSYEFEGARIDIDQWDLRTYPYPYMEIEVANENVLSHIVKILDIKKEQVSTKSIVELRQEIGLE